jgi:hypothetical protein
LHLESPRDAGGLHLYGDAGTQIIDANRDSASPEPIDGNEVLITGLPNHGIDISCEGEPSSMEDEMQQLAGEVLNPVLSV